ncbi:MAG: alpha/beta fold hydrolase [Candidatus Omnitrophica bacterium]|nr:alpha/beta fold hydrolase [Candidatus Omnitrophota bacterium]
MKRNAVLLFIYTFICAVLFVIFIQAPPCEDTIERAETSPAAPWDLEVLSEPPEFQWIDQTSKTRSLIYMGPPYQDHKQTRVFAYYSTPGILKGDPSLDAGLPAMVLVHGGGGRAFEEWAALWAGRGYAAIAMDLAGCGMDGKRLPDGGPDQSDQTKFGNIDQPMTEQWTYHAVANVILAHSLIRSFAEVDGGRVGLTGISWGGYLTCITAGVDNRFKAAAPVYGCGFLHENSVWLDWFEKRFTPDQAKKWIRLWDPSMYAGSAVMPMLFINGGRDFAYPPDSHSKTYGLVRSEKNLYYVPDLNHGHIFDRPNELEIFIDSQLKGGEPLPRITAVHVDQGMVRAKAAARKLTSAVLYFTYDPMRMDHRKRTWTEQEAQLDENVIQCEEPKEAAAWFLTATDDRGATVASELQFPKAE